MLSSDLYTRYSTQSSLLRQCGVWSLPPFQLPSLEKSFSTDDDVIQKNLVAFSCRDGELSFKTSNLQQIFISASSSGCGGHVDTMGPSLQSARDDDSWERERELCWCQALVRVRQAGFVDRSSLAVDCMLGYILNTEAVTEPQRSQRSMSCQRLDVESQELHSHCYCMLLQRNGTQARSSNHELIELLVKTKPRCPSFLFKTNSPFRSETL
jgi:hypothetical protein